MMHHFTTLLLYHPLHPPHHYIVCPVVLQSVPYLLFPRYIFVCIEEDEVPLFYIAYSLHVFGGLFESFCDKRFSGIATLNFQFKHNALNGAAIAVGQWFGDEQVGSSTAQAILPVNVAATIHYALEEGLQQ